MQEKLFLYCAVGCGSCSCQYNTDKVCEVCQYDFTRDFPCYSEKGRHLLEARLRAKKAGIVTAPFYSSGYSFEIDWEKAEKGDSDAMVRIGNRFSSGWGVPLDYQLSTWWFSLASKKGNGDGMTGMGRAYLYGLGLPEDHDKALSFLQAGDRQNSPTASVFLGLMHLWDDVTVVEKNPRRATRWFRRSAKLGDAYGELQFGKSYLYGRGIQKNISEAIRWLRKSADNGEGEAWRWLGELYYEDEDVTANYAVARTCYRKGAEQNDALSQYSLGLMLLNGEGGEVLLDEALLYLEQAGKQDIAPACRELAALYLNGQQVAQDLSQVKYWATKGADLDDTACLRIVGRYYFNLSDEEDRNTLEGLNFLTRAAEKGDALSCRLLMIIYEQGKAIPQDLAAADHWRRKGAEVGDQQCLFDLTEQLEEQCENDNGANFEKILHSFMELAEAGFDAAQIKMGFAYQFGEWGINPDREKAIYWYQRAADQGNKAAINLLQKLL